MLKKIPFIRKFFLILLTVLFITSIAVSVKASESKNNYQFIKNTVEENFKANLEQRGMSNIELDAEILSEMETPKGFYFVKVNINDRDNNKQATDYIITNGEYLLPDVIDISQGESIKSSLAFRYDVYDINTEGLTLIYGKKSADNIIVDISDFQCPYCKRAYKYIKEKVKDMDNVAVYKVHLPLKIHNKAVIYAKIFEAGKMLGVNFADELYSGEYDKMDKNEILEKFAANTDNPEKFKTLVNSDRVQKKLDRSKQLAESLGVNSTPVVFFNGRKVEGFNTELIDKGLELFN
jgi:protein-disulfide isomerase